MAHRFPRLIPALVALIVLVASFATPPGGARPLVAATWPALYTVTDLGVLPGYTASYAAAINNAGQVVVRNRSANGEWAAALWDAADGLRKLPGGASQAFAVNEVGQVVGQRGSRAALWDAAGQLHDLVALPDSSVSAAYRINAPGQVAGTSDTRAVLWDAAGKIRALDDDGFGSTAFGINDQGQVAGALTTSLIEQRAVRWDPDGRRDLPTPPGFDHAGAQAINNAGVAVGWGTLAGAGLSHALQWDAAGRARDLGTLPEYTESFAYDINNAGLVVGFSGLSATLWDVTGQPHNLNHALYPTSGWNLALASGLNDRGQIVGYGQHAGQTRAFLLTLRFADLPADTPFLGAILALAAQGVIRGYGDGRVGPDDPVLRAQAAALLARALGWDAENWADITFPDQGAVDDDLWRNVQALAHHRVALGYPDGTYDPTGAVLEQQAILFIARAMLTSGRWQPQPDTGPYANLPGDTARERDDRAAIATYVHYAGAAPDRPTGAGWATWDQAATRGWVAQALWQALAAPSGP